MEWVAIIANFCGFVSVVLSCVSTFLFFSLSSHLGGGVGYRFSMFDSKVFLLGVDGDGWIAN